MIKDLLRLLTKIVFSPLQLFEEDINIPGDKTQLEKNIATTGKKITFLIIFFFIVIVI